jgi:heat-inducible transcriptional repressor
MEDFLSYREKEVLKFIIENFIMFASPVASKVVSKKTSLNLSSATIRNIMGDLEEKDLLETPHTSAGRVPTDKGLRFYVDSLMNKGTLRKDEIDFLQNKFEEIRTGAADEEDIYKETSKILGKISRQLSIVTQPFLDSGMFEKMEMIPLASNKVLVIFNIKSGIVRTVIMELEIEFSAFKLEEFTRFLNEKLSGLTLRQIRETFSERVNPSLHNDPELIQLFIDSVDKVYYDEDAGENIYISGTGEVIDQPEFEDPQSFKNIITLSENKNLVVHILQNEKDSGREISISIGSENENDSLKNYSIITSNYSIGDIRGKIGIIGPRRLNYSKMVPILEYTSKLISELYK